MSETLGTGAKQSLNLLHLTWRVRLIGISGNSFVSGFFIFACLSCRDLLHRRRVPTTSWTEPESHNRKHLRNFSSGSGSKEVNSSWNKPATLIVSRQRSDNLNRQKYFTSTQVSCWASVTCSAASTPNYNLISTIFNNNNDKTGKDYHFHFSCFPLVLLASTEGGKRRLGRFHRSPYPEEGSLISCESQTVGFDVAVGEQQSSDSWTEYFILRTTKWTSATSFFVILSSRFTKKSLRL